MACVQIGGDVVSNKGIVSIHGKQYKTVVLRVNEFRENCSIQDGWGVNTSIVYHDDDKVIVCARITDPDGRVVGSGHGEEFRAQGKINKTSALENAETSAIGRCLASIGLGGEEYASADEVLRAISQQNEHPTPKSKPVVEERPVEWIKTPKPEPDDDSTWEDTTEILNTVKNNVKIGIDKLGEDAYRVWHKRVLENMFSVEKIADLSDADSLRRFSIMQTERFDIEKGK
jgi:hypothetical protein